LLSGKSGRQKRSYATNPVMAPGDVRRLKQSLGNIGNLR
jgi:large subunit ribosomal protein L35